MRYRISRGRNYDPISFEEFVDNGNWVLEDEPPLLTADEIELFRKQMAGLTIEAEDNGDSSLITNYHLCIGSIVSV